jgi:hypothetical protein
MRPSSFARLENRFSKGKLGGCSHKNFANNLSTVQ